MPTPELPAIETGVSLQADSAEQIISRQLDLLAQFSGLMSQQLSVLGPGRPLAPPTNAVKAQEPRKQEAQGTSTPYVPFKPVQPGVSGGFSDRQRQHLSELVERFTRHTSASKQLAQQYR